MSRSPEIRDTEGRRWEVRRHLSHDSEEALLVERYSGSARRRFGRCRIRFRRRILEGDEIAEIVSQGVGEIEEEERDDGSIRSTRVPPRGEVVGRVVGEDVVRLREIERGIRERHANDT